MPPTTAINVAELRYGIERMPEGKRKAATETEFRFLIEDYANRLLDFDGPSAAEWAGMLPSYKPLREKIGGNSLTCATRRLPPSPGRRDASAQPAL